MVDAAGNTARRRPTTSNIRGSGSISGMLLGNRRFIGYILSAALGCGAFFVYVGAGPHVIITMMERSPTEYGVWFIPTAGGYIVGNIITSRLSVRFGVDPMIFWGNVMNLAGIAADLRCCRLYRRSAHLVIVLPGTLMGLANGIILPNSIAGAVSVRPQAAGTASGMTGFTQMLFGAAMTQFTGHIIVSATSVTPALLCMLATAITCLVVYVVLLATEAVVGAGRKVTTAWRYLPINLNQSSSVNHGDARVARLVELRTCARTRDHIVGLLRHRTRNLGAKPLRHRLGLVARHLFQRAGEHHGLAGNGRILRSLGILDRRPVRSAARQSPNYATRQKYLVMTVDDRLADLIERVHFLARFGVTLGDPQAGIVKRRPTNRSRAPAPAPSCRRHGGCRAHR